MFIKEASNKDYVHVVQCNNCQNIYIIKGDLSNFKRQVENKRKIEILDNYREQKVKVYEKETVAELPSINNLYIILALQNRIRFSEIIMALKRTCDEVSLFITRMNALTDISLKTASIAQFKAQIKGKLEKLVEQEHITTFTRKDITFYVIRRNTEKKLLKILLINGIISYSGREYSVTEQGKSLLKKRNIKSIKKLFGIKI